MLEISRAWYKLAKQPGFLRRCCPRPVPYASSPQMCGDFVQVDAARGEELGRAGKAAPMKEQLDAFVEGAGEREVPYRRAPPGQGDRPSRGLLRAGGEVQPCARTEADEGLVDRRGLKVAQARSAPARTGLSIPGSKMIRLGDHAAGKPPRISVPRTPP